MSSRLIGGDYTTKTQIHFHAVGDGEFVIEETQDVEDVVQDNREVYKQYDERARFGDKMNDHHVAHIPAVVVARLMREGIWNDRKALKKWLNDPDNRVFRTRPGRV